MTKNRSGQLSAIINVVIFAVLLLLHFCEAFRITALRANPVTVIPMLVAFSFFNEEWVSTLTGMTVGFFMDSSAARFSIFHTIVLALIGLFATLIVRYLFNNNVKSAIMLSLIATLFYFVLRCIFFHIIGGNIKDSLFYLMYYAFPSVIYTNLFIIPFYYLQKKLHSIG